MTATKHPAPPATFANGGPNMPSLTTYRLAHGATYDQLATYLGVAPRTLYRWVINETEPKGGDRVRLLRWLHEQERIWQEHGCIPTHLSLTLNPALTYVDTEAQYEVHRLRLLLIDAASALEASATDLTDTAARLRDQAGIESEGKP